MGSPCAAAWGLLNWLHTTILSLCVCVSVCDCADGNSTVSVLQCVLFVWLVSLRFARQEGLSVTVSFCLKLNLHGEILDDLRKSKFHNDHLNKKTPPIDSRKNLICLGWETTDVITESLHYKKKQFTKESRFLSSTIHFFWYWAI